MRLSWIWTNFALITTSVFLCSPVVLSHIDDNSRAKSLGKAEDLARGDLEFRLSSTSIRSYSLLNFETYKYVLLVAVSSRDCQSDNFDIFIESIQKPNLKSKNFRVVLIDSNPNPDRKKISERSRSSIYLFDSLQQVSPSLGFKKSGDFVLIDPRAPAITGRGHLADADVQTTLPPEIAKAWPKTAQPTPSNCPLVFDPIFPGTFAESFLPSFTRACQACHIRSEIYDQFTTLDQTLGWRAMSLKTIRLQRMPGGFDPYFQTHRIPGSATVEDVRRVTKWLTNPPPITDEMRNEFLMERNRIRKVTQSNDFELPVLLTRSLVKPVIVPAQGTVAYHNEFLGELTKEDMVVQAIRLKTNLNAAHHLNLLAFKAGEFTEAEYKNSTVMPFKTVEETYRRHFGKTSITKTMGTLNGKKVEFFKVDEPIITTFSRRAGVQVFDANSAVVIPKGSQLAVQIHLEPSGKEEVVDAKFELLGRVSTKPYGQLKRMSFTPSKNFEIPPGQNSYVSRATAKFDKRIRLKLLWIHTHYRGAATRIQIQSANGQLRTIASVPFMQLKIDQGQAFGGNGIVIEPGETLISEIEYDNSKSNLANPDPTASVRLGKETLKDEMHFPRFLYIED